MGSRSHVALLVGLLYLFTCCRSGASAEVSYAPQTDKLRVITYNVQFLPGLASAQNERPKPNYRARRIAEEASKFDIVGLQELFDETHRQQICDRIGMAWDKEVETVVSPTPNGFFTSGGCLLLSQRPLVASDSTVFENFSKPADYGLRADGFAAKGVIHGRFARQADATDDCIDVFVTHLEARDDALRPLQYGELAAFVREKSDPRFPVLIMGDFNTRGAASFRSDPDSQYSALMKQLRQARPADEVIDVWPHLKGADLGGTSKQESHEIGKRIDYIFVCNPPSPHSNLKPVNVEVRLFQDPEVVALSDHNAVVTELEWLSL